MNIEFELPHGIAQDLSRIADSLDTIVAIMRGQHTQPIPVHQIHACLRIKSARN